MAAVPRGKVSVTRLSEIEAMNYNLFREMKRIGNQVRLEWSGPVQGSFGPEPPGNRDVFARQEKRPLLEVAGQVDLRVLVWE
jgi:hypothetical protein